MGAKYLGKRYGIHDVRSFQYLSFIFLIDSDEQHISRFSVEQYLYNQNASFSLYINNFNPDFQNIAFFFTKL